MRGGSYVLRSNASQRIDLPHAAHLPNMEQPEAFNAAVLAFLAER